jgi:PREDICTED: similar to 26S proteasome regulatory chain 4
MSKCEDIRVDEIVDDKNLSGADIRTICINAGLFALRDKRLKVNNQDFLAAKQNFVNRGSSFV